MLNVCNSIRKTSLFLRLSACRVIACAPDQRRHCSRNFLLLANSNESIMCRLKCASSSARSCDVFVNRFWRNNATGKEVNFLAIFFRAQMSINQLVLVMSLERSIRSFNHFCCFCIATSPRLRNNYLKEMLRNFAREKKWQSFFVIKLRVGKVQLIINFFL